MIWRNLLRRRVRTAVTALGISVGVRLLSRSQQIQVALSVVVLQVFVRRNLVWLWIAIGAHAVVDLIATAVPQLAGTSVRTMALSELVVAGWGMLALFVIWRLRQTSILAGSIALMPRSASPDLTRSARGI